MRTNTTRLPLLALAGLVFHGADNVAIGDTYVDQAEDFFPPVTAQLVAHFPLDGDGDSTLGGFEADIVRDVTFGGAGANANTGTSASFNGENGFIRHAFDTNLNPQSFTLAFWAKQNPSTLAGSPVTGGFLILSDPNASQWIFASTSVSDPDNFQTLSGQAVQGNWQHIAVTYDDAIEQKKFYIDGILVGTINDSIVPNTDAPFSIGAAAPSGLFDFPFDGEIDDIGIWNGALSLQQIQLVRSEGVRSPVVLAQTLSWNGASGRVGGLSYGTNAFTSIQEAIDAVEDGGTVHIAQGLYAEGAELRTGKNVTIIGAGAQVTEINGGDSHRVFNITGDFDVALSGLSITRGQIAGGGGGIRQFGGTLSVTDCAFTSNSAALGGGISSAGRGLMVTGSTFQGNGRSGGTGGGLYISSRATIVNSTVSGNFCIGGTGGGIHVNYQSAGVEAINCTITLNLAAEGAGIYTDGTGFVSGNIRVSNSIIAGNSASDVRSVVIDGTNSITSGGGNFVGSDTTSPNSEGLKAFAIDLRFDNTSASRLTDVISTELTYNGGNTATHRLVPGSPAINAGIDAAAVDPDGNPLLTDQRGVSFPRLTCLNIDSGAVEADPTACPPIAQKRLDEGTLYDTDTGQGIELDTASIKFADVIDDGGVPFPGGEGSNFDPDLVQASIDLYKEMVLSPPFLVPGFDTGGVTVTSRGPGLVEDPTGGGNADFDRHPNPFGGHTIGLTNFTEVERAIANPVVSFSITNHNAVNFGDPDTDLTASGKGRILPDEPFPNNTVDVDDNNFLITFEANLVIPATGTYYLGFQGDDGGYLRIPGQTFSNLYENVTGKSVIDEGGARIICDVPTGDSSTVGIISLTEGVYPIQGGFFEREGGAHFEVFAIEPWTEVSALIMRNGAGLREASALDLAANQTKLLEAIRGMMVPYVFAAKNAQAYGAKARLIPGLDLDSKEQEMDDNARSHLENALQAFENFARDPQLDYLLRDPVPIGFSEDDPQAIEDFRKARRKLFSAYGRALAALAQVDLRQIQRDYLSAYDVEVYRGSQAPTAIDAVADRADDAASLLQMRLLIIGALNGLEEFPDGDFSLSRSAVSRLRGLASAIRLGETIFLHGSGRLSSDAGQAYGSYFIPFFYESGETGSVFSSFGRLLTRAKDLAGQSRAADATALMAIVDYAFNSEAVETRLRNLLTETNSQLAVLCGTIIEEGGSPNPVPDIVGIYYRYPESGENEPGWSPGQIFQQRISIRAAQNRYLSAASNLVNIRERAQGVLETFLKKKTLNENFVENILTKNNEQLIGLSSQAGELEADLIDFRAKTQARLKRSQGGGQFGRFVTGMLSLASAAAIVPPNDAAAIGALANIAVGENDIMNEAAAIQSIAREESSVRRQITALETQKLEISFETELARIDFQMEVEEDLVLQEHGNLLREASRAEIDLESARIDILAQESALRSMIGQVNFILSELIAELSALEDSIQNSPDTRIIRDAAIERADAKLIQAQEWAFLAARSGQYLSFGNNVQFDYFLEMESRVLAERNSQDLVDYLQQVENRWDLTGISNGLLAAQEVSLSLKNDVAQANYRTADGIVYDFRTGEFAFNEGGQETRVAYAGADRRTSESAFGDFLYQHRVPDDIPESPPGAEMILIPFSISLQPTIPQLTGAFGPRNAFYDSSAYGVLIDGSGGDSFGTRVNIRAKGTFSGGNTFRVILRPRGVFSIYHQSPSDNRSAIRYWPFDYNVMDREAGIIATVNGAAGANPQLHGLSPANDRWELLIRDQDANNNVLFDQLSEIQDIEIIFTLRGFTDTGDPPPGN